MASNYQELTLILGPPAKGPAREAFERLQAAVGAGCEEEATLHKHRQSEFFTELFRAEAGTPSIMDDLMSAILRVPVRIRRYEMQFGIARGVWVPCLIIDRGDVETLDGSPLASPTDDDARETLAACLGDLLELDWVISVASSPPRPEGARDSDAILRGGRAS